MARTYAVLEMHSAKLTTEFGLEWATKLFGAEAIDSLPKYVRGEHTGQPKGYVRWFKVTKPGWSREVNSVVAGGIPAAWIAAGNESPRDLALSGQWMGRVQQLSGLSHHLFDEGRARHAAEQARRDADWEIEKAEMLAEREARKAAEQG